MALTDNLIEYWPLNEVSGNRAGAHAGKTLTDIGGVGSAAGKVYALAADSPGSGTVRLERTDEADLSLGNFDFTWAAWLWLTAKGDNRPAVFKGVDDVQNHIEFSLEFKGVPDRFAAIITSGADLANFTQLTANNFGSPSLETWYFVVGWHDAAGDTVNIQVNNGTPNSSAYTFGSYDSPGAFTIGMNNNFADVFSGRIGPVMFWKRVLTSDERTQLWNGGNGLPYSQFVVTGATMSIVEVARRPRPFAPGIAR